MQDDRNVSSESKTTTTTPPDGIAWDSAKFSWAGKVMLAAGLGLLVLSLLSCERSVGVGDGDGGTNDPDATADGGQPDAGGAVFLQDIMGWRAESFEHAAFVPEELADESQLDACDPYLSAREGEERWWASGGYEGALDLYPHLIAPDRLGLMRASGWLSPEGAFGHDGWYQRVFEITEWELLVCPTVERLGHCPAPRPADLCVLPGQASYEDVVTHLRRIVPGPASLYEHYELTVTFDPNVLDGTTEYSADFTLPLPGDPSLEWEPIAIEDVEDLYLLEERQWNYHELIEYPLSHDGWVLRNVATDTLKVSLSGSSSENETVHVWGDFPVDEVIYAP